MAMTTRRSFLAGGALGALTILKYGPARAAEFTFKLGHDQPVTHPQHLRALEAAEKVKQESDGQLIVQVYPNSQLGGDTQMLAQVRSGALELLQVGDNVLATIVPVTSVSGFPFAFKGYDDLWSTMDGDFGKLLRSEIAKVGLHVFDKGWDAGFRHIFTSGKAVSGPDSLKGLKLRVPQAPIQLATFRAFGASPTPVNNNELYTSLQTHLVDGAEQPLISIESARLYEVSSQIALTNHQPTPFEMLANMAAWRRLPSKLQEILTRSLNNAAMLQRADIRNGEIAIIAQLKTQGQTVTTPDREAFKKVIEDAGLYKTWAQTYGVQAVDLLEASVGKLT